MKSTDFKDTQDLILNGNPYVIDMYYAVNEVPCAKCGEIEGKVFTWALQGVHCENCGCFVSDDGIED